MKPQEQESSESEPENSALHASSFQVNLATVPVQCKSGTPGTTPNEEIKRPNKTRLPDNLKAGLEQLSGLDMSDVKVHYNSPRPAQLNALAYTQGTDVHVSPGQEKHLPHEAWHIVQQAQGRVQPTMQTKAGVKVNDDQRLEREADVLGAKAMAGVVRGATGALTPLQLSAAPVVQGKFNRKEFDTDIIRGRETGREDEEDKDLKLKENRTTALTMHLIKKQDTQKHRDQTQQVLSKTDDPRSIIATVVMQRPDDLLPKFAENSIEKGKEDMPYYHHAQMVMGQYNKYFSPQVKEEEAKGDGLLISDKLMKMMMAFHDINKQRSIEMHGKIGEHTDTVTGLSEFSRDWGFSGHEIRIACEIVGADPFGDYFKQVADIRANTLAVGGGEKVNALLEEARVRCFRAIAKAARNASVPASKMTEFFERYLMFYQSDFSSYMTDSSYQDKHFKPGQEKDKKKGDKPDEYSGPDSFTPEFFAHEEDGDKSSPLKLAENKKRLEFSSEKKLNAEARVLEAMFQKENVEENLQKYAPESLIAQSVRKDNENESQRAKMEMIRAKAKERMQDNPYINFEQPVIALSKALTKLKSKHKLSAVVQELGQLADDAANQVAKDYDVTVDIAQTIIQACRALCALMPKEGGKEESSKSKEQPKDDVMSQFSDGGIFIRKLLPEANTKGREIVDKDINTIEQYVLRQPTTPFVMPATLVKKGVPVNLTNAQEALQHSSGLIYDQSTKIAPSTKEHNESASLSRVLTEPVRARIHDEETWKSVVRPPISKMGGKSYDTRAELADKLDEMELRRSGKIPDLSTKELLFEVLKPLDDSDHQKMVDLGDFDKALKQYLHTQALPEFIQKQLAHRFQTIQDVKIQKPIEDGGSGKKFDQVTVGNRLKYIRLALSKKRQDRDHSIYGGEKDGRTEKPGNRYFRKDKQESKHGSSEAEGFDGKSFQTNEVLMLPEGIDFIRGIYSNSYSITSRLHSLNLTRELMLQSGRLPDLYNYTAMEGMSPTSVIQVLDEIHDRIEKGEDLAPPSGLIYDKKKPTEEEAPISKEDEQAKTKLERGDGSHLPISPLAEMFKKKPESSSGKKPGPEDEEQVEKDRAQRFKDLESFKGIGAVKNFSARDKVLGVEKAKKVWMPEQEFVKERSKPTPGERKKKLQHSDSDDSLDTSSSRSGKKEKEGRPGMRTPYPEDFGIPELKSRVVSIEVLRVRLENINELLRSEESEARRNGMLQLDQLITHVDWQIAEMEPDASERQMFASGNGPNLNYPTIKQANVPAYNMWLFFRELMDLRRLERIT